MPYKIVHFLYLIKDSNSVLKFHRFTYKRIDLASFKKTNRSENPLQSSNSPSTYRVHSLFSLFCDFFCF